jgi:PAS domain S-box-containing protein
LDIEAKWDSSDLTLVLNVIFVIIPALVITFIAVRSFIRTGVWSVLWMGIGVLTFGLAAVLSNWLRITSSNNATTVYSIIALLAGVFHFFAGYFSLNRVSPSEPGPGRLSALLQVYFVALAFIVSVAVIGGLGQLPPFVVNGVGTSIRVMVQVTALSLFLLAGLMLARQFFRSKSRLLYWYSLGLLLICLSMIGAILQKTGGSPISWTARSAQYFGGAYLFVAALVILKEARIKELPVDEALAGQFNVLQTRLKESEENYRSLFNNMSEGFAVCEMIYDPAGNPVDYRFLNVNPMIEKQFGFPMDQIIGKNIKAIIPNVQPKAIENFGKVISTGEPLHFENYSRDLRKWFDVYSYKSGSGRFAYLLLDITERKKAEEALRESEAKANALIKYAPTGIYEIDFHEPSFLSVNDAMCYLSGYTREELLAIGPMSLLVEESRKKFGERIKRQLAGEKIDEMIEYRVKKKDGSLMYVTLNVSFSKDKPGTAFVIGHDVTERIKAEEALRESEERYRELVENANSIIMRADKNFNIIYMNEFGLKFFGYTPQEILGKNVIGTTIPEHDESGTDLSAMVTGISRQPEKYKTNVHQNMRKTGELVWISWTNHVSFDRNGEFSSILAIGNDISSLKKAEEALLENERNSAFLLELTDTLKPLSDIIAIEETSSRLLGEHLKADRVGYFKIEGGDCVIERDYAPSVPHLSGRFPVAAFGERLMSAYQTGRMVVMNNIAEEPLTPEERRSYLGIQVQAQISMPLIKNGEFLGGMTVHRAKPRVWTSQEQRLLEETAERTWAAMERKKAEESLKESEERFRALANNIPQLAWMADGTGWLFWYNQRWYNYTGTNLEEMKGWGWQKVHHPDYVQPVTGKFSQHVATGEAWEDTFPLRGKDGNYRWFLSRAFPIRDAQGMITRWFGTNTDITETLEAEDKLKRYTSELESANKELESFAYSVSHDLRAPLRTLDGFSEMVVMEYGDKLDETGKDYLNRIRKAGQTMSQLTEDILKLSRITRAEMHNGTVNLSEMAISIADELKATQSDRRAEFIIVPDMMVNGDKALLQILLRNLLENSWKYTGKRTDVQIEMGVSRQDDKTVYFVKDNGIGFDMQYKDKLFQPFQRLHNDKGYPGTGIGLATAQRVVRKHGGDIWAESEMGKGTTFYFTLG